MESGVLLRSNSATANSVAMKINLQQLEAAWEEKTSLQINATGIVRWQSKDMAKPLEKCKNHAMAQDVGNLLAE